MRDRIGNAQQWEYPKSRRRARRSGRGQQSGSATEKSYLDPIQLTAVERTSDGWLTDSNHRLNEGRLVRNEAYRIARM